MKYLLPLVPEKCLVCGKSWKSGSEKPGERMKKKSTIIYECGCLTSVKINKDNTFKIKVKNCWCDDNLKAESDQGISKPSRMSLNIPLEFNSYFLITKEEDDFGPFAPFYSLSIQLDEGEAELHYGHHIAPIFTTNEKALGYIKNYVNDYKIYPFTVKEIIKQLLASYSHVIVDPIVLENGDIPCTDEFLSDLTVL